MTTIRDGTGNGTVARVNSENRLAVTTENFSNIAIASAVRSQAYSVGSGSSSLSLTAAAGESTVLYVKNNSENTLLIDNFAVSGDQAGVWTLYRNPTGGTITTSGTTITPVNLNYSSGGTLDGDAILGADGLTTTGGDVVLRGRVPAAFISLDIKDAIALGNGSVFTLTFTPEADADVTVFALVAYRAVE
jgi:hypothetical protein